MEKIVVKKDRQIVFKFDGYTDMAQYVDAKHKRDGASATGTASFCGGTKTVKQADAMMVAGYDDVLPTITSIRDKVRERVGSIDTTVFRAENNVYGTRLDMGSYLADSPTCFLDFYEDPDKRATRFVRILVDTTFSAMVKAEDIKTRGAAVVALCDTLNLCGYTTEVWAVSTNGGSYRHSGEKELAVLLPVQRVGESWDVRSAMYPLAHPSFLRRTVFGVMESMTESEREVFGVGYGYGSVIQCRKGSLADVHCGGADIICSTYEGEIRDMVKNPVKWVLSQCKNLGVIGVDEQ
jgi:hypothetical protein